MDIDQPLEFIEEVYEDEGKCVDHSFTFGVALSIFLFIGSFISYLPQQITILRNKSSEGLSLQTLLMGNIAGLCLLINVVILEWGKYSCCSEVGLWSCHQHLLPLYQLIFGLIHMFIIYSLAVAFNPNNIFNEKVVYCSFVVAMITTLTMATTTHFLDPLAQIFGISAAVVTCFQWIPQIIEVYQRRSGGSLSLLMLMIQCPGALMVAISFSVVYSEDWSTWINYVFAFSQQLILIIQILYYRFFAKKEERNYFFEDRKGNSFEEERKITI